MHLIHHSLHLLELSLLRLIKLIYYFFNQHSLLHWRVLLTLNLFDSAFKLVEIESLKHSKFFIIKNPKTLHQLQKLTALVPFYFFVAFLRFKRLNHLQITLIELLHIQNKMSHINDHILRIRVTKNTKWSYHINWQIRF